jgi:predicted dehydrogenase
MMATRRVDRREFVTITARGAAAAATLGAAPLLRAFEQGSPNEQVRIAVIGFGVQGLIDANAALRVPNVRVVGAASCYDGHLERARELLGDQAILTRDYRRLLDNRDVDAVIIATPNHWHLRACIDALAAGKDVYCEKPLTAAIDEGERIVKAVRASDRVFQVGSQHTSSPHVIEARQVIGEGLLGQVTQVKASWDTNNEISAWVKPIPPDASQQTIDWPRFQGSAPKKPFDPKRVFRWRTHREYGGGLAGDVLVHIITAVHYMLNLGVPTVATAVGGRLMWKDDRSVYDTITGGWEYPEGIVTVLGATQNNGYNGTQIEVLGSKASMVLTFSGYAIYEEDSPPNWRYTTNAWPKTFREEYWTSKGLPVDAPPNQPQQPRTPKVVRQWTAPEPGSPRVPHHMQQFIDCVRARRTPVQDVVMGNNAAITAHMADESYFNRRTIFFDRATRKLVSRPTS